MEIAQIQKEVHETSQEHGWWDEFEGLTIHQITHFYLSKIALIHSELSEASECIREGEFAPFLGENGKPCGLPIELADAVIRILDFAEFLGIDLEKAIVEKHAYNKTRPFRHGNKLA